MSFFDSIKKSLGISKDKSSTGIGYHLFEVTFTEDKLGIGITKYNGDMPHLPDRNGSTEISCPMVTNLDVKKFGIQPGDLIVSLEGNDISSFDDFTTIVKAIGRPVRIRFLRKDIGAKHNSNETGSVVSSSSSGGGVVSSALNSMNPMRLLSSSALSGGAAPNSDSKPAIQQVVLTEEEKHARRERLSAAAVERSKTWDRKLGQKKNQSSSSSSLLGVGNSSDKNTGTDTAGIDNLSNVPVSSETEKAIRKTKAEEVKIEQQLGYSPFRPHMSFTSASGPSNDVSEPSQQQQTLTALVEGATAETDPALEAAVDDAFAMLLSLGEQEQERGRVAVSTVYKMLLNLYSSPEDPKLRSIRVNNKAFQSRVACVPGGAEILLAAGYTYTPSTCMNIGCEARNPEQEVEQEERFLLHAMDFAGKARLSYTLSRILELLESAGGNASPTS